LCECLATKVKVQRDMKKYEKGDEGVDQEGNCAGQELLQHSDVSERARTQVDLKTDVNSASSTLSVWFRRRLKPHPHRIRPCGSTFYIPFQNDRLPARSSKFRSRIRIRKCSILRLPLGSRTAPDCLFGWRTCPPGKQWARLYKLVRLETSDEDLGDWYLVP
jgi:hypothetical protein